LTEDEAPFDVARFFNERECDVDGALLDDGVDDDLFFRPLFFDMIEMIYKQTLK
jgi:hypothetical protein